MDNAPVKQTPEKPALFKGAPGPGRPKGVPNKSTTQAREAIAAFVEGNTARMQAWLDEIAEKDPEKAFDKLMAVMEYHLPKMARVEHTGKDGAPMTFSLTNDEGRL